MEDKKLKQLAPQLINAIIKKYKLIPNTSIDVSKYNMSSLNKEDADYYSKNPGYFVNLMKEKQALQICEPQIVHICNGDPAVKNNSTLKCMRFIYSILTIKSSFDNSCIVFQRFNSDIWQKYIPDIIVTFDLNIEVTEKYDFDTIVNVTDECIHQWSGGNLIKKEDSNYYIENNGHNILN